MSDIISEAISLSLLNDYATEEVSYLAGFSGDQSTLHMQLTSREVDDEPCQWWPDTPALQTDPSGASSESSLMNLDREEVHSIDCAWWPDTPALHPGASGECSYMNLDREEEHSVGYAWWPNTPALQTDSPGASGESSLMNLDVEDGAWWPNTTALQTNSTTEPGLLSSESLGSGVNAFNFGWWPDAPGMQQQAPNSTHSDHNQFVYPLKDGKQPIIEIRKELINPTDYGDIVKNINPNRRSSDDTEMYVPTAGNDVKRLFCIYCKKTYPKLARHLEFVHKEEADVKLLDAFPKGSKERKNRLAEIKNKGMFEWNMDLSINNKMLLTCRRPSPDKPKDPTDFKSCPKCLGMYGIKSIRHHVARCTNNLLMGERSVLALARAVEGRIHASASAILRTDIFPKLQDDHIARLIRFDWLIIVYGNKLTTKYPHKRNVIMIKDKLRLAGRQLHSIKEIRPEITDFASIYEPKHYDSLVAAIRNVGNFNSVTNLYGSPSTAAAAAMQIKVVGSLLVCEYIKQENVEKQTRTENFLKLFNDDASASIYRGVYDTQGNMARNKDHNIPTTSDVKCLAEYLDRERQRRYEILLQKFSYVDWLKLSELTMISIMVFNRKRVGETQYTLISDFNSRNCMNEEDASSLSAEDRLVAEKYKRMMIRGKRSRPVPVLIMLDVEKCLEIIIKCRQEAKITDANQYLFAQRSTVLNPIRTLDGCSAMREFSKACGAKNPGSLRGTPLRKHLATTCIREGASDNTVSEVADFMGHDEKIHRKNYRINPFTSHAVNVSKILVTAQGGESSVVGGSPTHRIELSSDRPNHKRKKNATVECKADGEPVEKKKREKWSTTEITMVMEAFATYFLTKTMPSVKVIDEVLAQEKYRELRTRTAKQIKAWISNNNKKAV